MFDVIAEHEGRNRDLFYEIAYFFYLTIYKLNVKSCFDVLFYYISRTRTAYRFSPWSTRLLYLCFIWNPPNSLRMWPSS